MIADALYFAESENSGGIAREFVFEENKHIYLETIDCPEKFKDRISQAPPQLVVLEILAKTTCRGRQLLHWLSKREVPINTIAICENLSETLDLLRMGAKSVVPQGNTSMLSTALDDVSNGYHFLPASLGPELARQIQSEYVPQKTRSLWGALANREKEILSHCHLGHGNKEIARLMGVSPKTLQNQITALLKKLNAPNLKTAEGIFSKIVYLEYRNFANP